MNPQGELSERYSVASESGSSTDSHAETPESKDGKLLCGVLAFICCALHVQGEGVKRKNSQFIVLLVLFSTVKKKYGAGLMFSNLMNIGKKKPSALESPEKCVDTSGSQKST